MSKNVYRKIVTFLLALGLAIPALGTLSVWALENSETQPHSSAADTVMPNEESAEGSLRSNRARRMVSPQTDRHTYIFKVDENEVERQIVKNGETLYEPAVPEKDGYRFLGWYSEEDTKVDFGVPIHVTQEETIQVSAKYEKMYYVFFMEGTYPGARVFRTKEGVTGFPLSTKDVKLPIDSSHAIINWYKDKDFTGTPVGDEYVVETSDQVLWPHIEQGYVVRFQSGKNATHVASQFVIYDQVTQEPAQPTRPGYNFKYWSEEEDGATPFTFGNKINADKKLYAVWEAKTDTPYVINYWIENADDTNYSLNASKKGTGTTNSTIVLQDNLEGYGLDNLTLDKDDETNNKLKNCFEFERYDQDKVIESDGSAVVNVYYKRKQFTLTFLDEFSNTLYTKTAKYNSYVADIFPILDPKSGKPVISKANSGVWHPLEEDVFAFDLQTLDRMPHGDVTLQLDLYDDEAKKLVYMVERLDEEKKDTESIEKELAEIKNNPDYADEYKHGIEKYIYDFKILKRVDTFFARITYDEEYHPIEGYDRFSPEESGFYAEDYENDEGYNLTAWYHDVSPEEPIFLRYIRHRYTLTMYNGGETFKKEEIPYEESLAAYYQQIPPTKPANVPDYYEFAGWYLSDNFSEDTRADEHLKNMPAGNQAVYAQWVQPFLKGTIYQTVDGQNPIEETLKYGEPIDINILPTVTDKEGNILSEGRGDKTIEIPEGYNWIGWSTKEGNDFIPFDLTSVVTKDLILYPQYVSAEKYTVTYKAGDGRGTPPVDEGLYAEYSYSGVLSAKHLTAPAGKVFVGWKVTSPAGDEVLYHAGDKLRITENMVLTAQWGDIKGKTKVTYNPGVGSDDAAIETAPLLINEKLQLPENSFTPKDGFEFIGWENASDGKVYAAGYSDLIADAEDEATTNLFTARWKKNVTVEKKWVGVADAKPEVSFKLLNKGAEFSGGQVAIVGGDSVTFDGSLKEHLKNATQVTWTVNPAEDDQFSVQEVGEANGFLSTSAGNYKVAYSGLTVTNEELLYRVGYVFESGTDGMRLPAGVLGVKPGDEVGVRSGRVVTPVQPETSVVVVSGGQWVFAGYDKDTDTIGDADVVFTGRWVFQAVGVTVEKTSAQASFVAVGDVLEYTVVVTNTGEVALPSVTVVDSKVDMAAVRKVESKNADGVLEPGETWSYTYGYTVTAEDMAAGGVVNTVTVTDNDRPDDPPTTTEHTVVKKVPTSSEEESPAKLVAKLPQTGQTLQPIGLAVAGIVAGALLLALRRRMNRFE